MADLSVWIPAASALFGTIIGGCITNYAASKRIDFEARQLRYNAKLKAYGDFLTESQRFLLSVGKEHTKNPDDLSDAEMDAGISYASTYSAAVLHAPEKMRVLIAQRYLASCNAAKTGEPGSVGEFYEKVNQAMHEDLRRTLERKTISVRINRLISQLRKQG